VAQFCSSLAMIYNCVWIFKIKRRLYKHITSMLEKCMNLNYMNWFSWIDRKLVCRPAIRRAGLHIPVVVFL